MARTTLWPKPAVLSDDELRAEALLTNSLVTKKTGPSSIRPSKESELMTHENGLEVLIKIEL